MHLCAMRKIVAGNWKMHKDRSEAAALVASLVEGMRTSPDVQVIIAPPFPFLADAVDATSDTAINVAAQNCHYEQKGAFTGEVSVPMLKSIGVGSCIVGHSERRQFFGETDQAVSGKIKALLKGGLTPIYCCGEVLEERNAGNHFNVVKQQMQEALSGLSAAEISELVIAYEPVWAIGTGLTATPEQAQEMHAFIRSELHAIAGDAANSIPILYGGSCKPDNAESLFSQKDVDGGLIGGASLDAGQFLELIEIAGRV
jgi:triosephosphate isomerase